MARHDTLPEDLWRIPGLFRRWELSEILETHRQYHIEDAGEHTDGTPLLSLYMHGELDKAPTARESGNRSAVARLIAADIGGVARIAEVIRELAHSIEAEHRTQRVLSALIDRLLHGDAPVEPGAEALNQQKTPARSQLPVTSPASTDV
jgi:hypothetical protein